MPGQLQDRVAIVTGAGRGIGREHALLFAAEGARVVVNDLGGTPDGTGADRGPAQQVVDEIRDAGGEAVANHDDVADFKGARRLVGQAVEAFGDLHVLVNNAGILRDRMLVNMTEDEWDAVIGVHLRGHFAPTRWAAAYWRDRHKAGVEGKRAVVNTTSVSGLFGNVGQANYGAAKTGIATFSVIADLELRRYGVRVNAIAPSAATRLIGTIPGADGGGHGGGDGGGGDQQRPEGEWSATDPANVSPFVAYLATEDCPVGGRVFFVQGGEVCLFQPFVVVDRIEKHGRWTVEELREQARPFHDHRFDYGHPIGEMLLGDRPRPSA
jgi:NAD(P)-dependent dehydrogenase (short-subunit alcohol dehydrogenase family)